MANDTYLTVGRLIRHYRLKNNVTQRQLAAAISFAEKSIGHYESGKRMVSIDVLSKISVFLQVPIVNLLDGIGYSSTDESDIDFHTLYNLLDDEYKQVVNATIEQLMSIQQAHHL